jgi:2-succinyl-5-enolpyruvyl-6-hydroxy-3-cyclohexene-1-carboxylate synthase
MEKIIWELTEADVFTQDFISKDSSKNLEKENLKLQLKIFAKNKTDRKTFYKSYDYYLKHEELLKPLLDTIIVRNGRIRESMRLRKIIKPINEQIK